MESNWNGLFLAEPRFRLALTFAVVGVLLQLGLWIIANKLLTSAANIAYIIVLRVILPRLPISCTRRLRQFFNSGNYIIISFFVGLNCSPGLRRILWHAGGLNLRKKPARSKRPPFRTVFKHSACLYAASLLLLLPSAPY